MAGVGEVVGLGVTVGLGVSVAVGEAVAVAVAVGTCATPANGDGPNAPAARNRTRLLITTTIASPSSSATSAVGRAADGSRRCSDSRRLAGAVGSARVRRLLGASVGQSLRS